MIKKLTKVPRSLKEIIYHTRNVYMHARKSCLNKRIKGLIFNVYSQHPRVE